ncbi:putative DUF21 domain-containing protein At3g13070, chloroplastic isoform X1 [Rosa chinensis]|nr:putative DUF21 domain-containing protein At3g13070, chloroplastic isoform X1 [Rosa chinensis]
MIHFADSMSVWNLIREFRIWKVHMTVVLNEYGGTVGIITLQDVVEEIVGKIFDENDSKEVIQKKGYIVMRAEGVFDVDANTSIDQLSEDLNVKMPEVRELAEKEPENGVFGLLRNDVTRFLATILVGTTVVNIGATALVTEAATAIFGEAGVSAATGVMTVLILLLTKITPKSGAVHNPTEVARFV